MIEMELREIQMSHVSPVNIVVLEEKDGDRSFPIYIGQNEAKAADDAVFDRPVTRPMTHDLILNVLEGLGATLEGVLVDSLEADCFHGKLLVRTREGKHIKIDSRPSDAIVLAMKVRAAIYVAEEVVDKVQRDHEE
ncbi:MAG: bifunctional nuclease family protein [Candidatus Sumerlaeia bacterium]|nr:bifunctional nuclease family protein [Candidatus Sumerlaeia bacterium]